MEQGAGLGWPPTEHEGDRAEETAGLGWPAEREDA
jgi:hypothetical protein